MPNRRRAPLTTALALTALATLVACGQPTPTPIDPATLPQEFSFEVANPDGVSGAVFAPVYETFGSFSGPMAVGDVAPTQTSAIRDAMDGATLALSGSVAGTLTPAAELARLNEAIGFLMGSGEVFFVPEGCDVTAVNPTEAAFASVLDLIVWDGATLDADGLPATTDAILELLVMEGAFETYHLLVASRTAWSATTNGACELDATSTYELDLDVAVGWQFLRVTFDATVGAEVTTFETRSLEDVAADGIVGLADTGGPILLETGARRLTPIYR